MTLAGSIFCRPSAFAGRAPRSCHQARVSPVKKKIRTMPVECQVLGLHRPGTASAKSRRRGLWGIGKETRRNKGGLGRENPVTSIRSHRTVTVQHKTRGERDGFPRALDVCHPKCRRCPSKYCWGLAEISRARRITSEI